MQSGNRHIVIGIYYHPEAFPPTLNAIEELSKQFNHIAVVHRPHLIGTWTYPKNVQAIPSGKVISSMDQQLSPGWRKLLFFVQFVIRLLKTIRRQRPSVILLYDVHALLAYWLIRPFINRHMLWYHNHDVWEIEGRRKFSLAWFACLVEKKAFKSIHIFTLPSAERLRYFPIHDLKGREFVIPNYPSLNVYQKFYQPRTLAGDIRLIFQGRIGEGHGLEQIIPLLTEEIAGWRFTLVLKGLCDHDYKERLLEMASKAGASDRIFFEGFTPYVEVPKISSTCHIGIGIFSKEEVMHVTLGTASNKLYEYAAVGLPVLYLNQKHFTDHLGKYSWAIPVELTTDSIREKLCFIIKNYQQLSSSAHKSFIDHLNYEMYFRDIARHLEAQRS